MAGIEKARFWRGFSLLLAGAGLAAVAAGLSLGEAALGVDATIGCFLFGIFAVLAGAIGGATAHAAVRRRERLARGEDVIARWRVEPETWQRFLAREAEPRPDGIPPNELVLPDAVPSDGIDVIVGRAAIQVGDSVHAVPEHGSPEVLWATLDDRRLGLSVIEMALKYPGGDRPDTTTMLRFPVAVGSLAAARTVAAHFARETPQRPGFLHGPGDGSDPEDLARCWSCGYETYKLSSACARCGATMQSRRWSRRTGVVLMVLGGGLAAGTGFLLVVLLPALRRAGQATGGLRFDGEPAMAWGVIALLAAIVAFGAATFAYGVFQTVTGGRSRIAVNGMIGLVVAIVLMALLLARAA